MARTNDRPDLEYAPYPYPPKLGLLLVLGLTKEATPEQYHARWNELMTPVIGGKNHNALALDRHLHEVMAENKCSWQEACKLASQTARGRTLLLSQT